MAGKKKDPSKSYSGWGGARPNSGGPRPGAGMKPNPNKPSFKIAVVRLEPKLFYRLKSVAKVNGLAVAEQLRAWIAEKTEGDNLVSITPP